MASYREAVDEILAQFRTVWLAQAPAALGVATAPPVLYPHQDTGQEPALTAQPFARVFVTHATGEQRSLGAAGGRVFTNEGIVFVQVFAPLVGGAGFDKAQRLAEVAKAAFEGVRTASVWFRAARFQEIGAEGPFYQINVAADFEWSQTL
jgi:hypothetical protein